MSRSIVAEGKTTSEAIEKGLKELDISSRNMVDVKIIEEGKKRSFYSILAPRVVKVELTVKDGQLKKEERKEAETIKKEYSHDLQEIEKAEKAIKEFLNNFLKDGNKATVEIKQYDIMVNIEGENANKLIGYRGETINAVQTILTAIANKHTKEKIKVFLDIAGYKEKRVKTLEDLAEKISKTVIRTGKVISLEPMTAYERKIIHTKLQNNSKVKTYSKGEEPYRRVVIAIK